MPEVDADAVGGELLCHGLDAQGLAGLAVRGGQEEGALVRVVLEAVDVERGAGLCGRRRVRGAERAVGVPGQGEDLVDLGGAGRSGGSGCACALWCTAARARW